MFLRKYDNAMTDLQKAAFRYIYLCCFGDGDGDGDHHLIAWQTEVQDDREGWATCGKSEHQLHVGALQSTYSKGTWYCSVKQGYCKV